MYKISDFIISFRVIEAACKYKCTPFIDLQVDFGEVGSPCFEKNKIYVGKTISISHTMYNIIYTYFDNFQKINGVPLFQNDSQKKDIFLLLASFLRNISYSSNVFPESKPNSPVINYLYRWTAPWIIMKDLICPSFQYPIKNCKIISYCSPFADISVFVDNEYMQKNNIENKNAPFIFVNSDIEYEPCVNASLLLSAIKAHDLDPVETVYNIYNSELMNKLIGFSELAFFEEKKSQDFISLLLTMTGIENKSENMISTSTKKVMEVSDKIKQAQSFDQVYGNWWYLGLAEKMLEPVRGPDWSTHQRLQPFLDELWDKVEVERKKRGRDGLTYESLLRIKDGENDPNKTVVFERMLASDRIW